MVHYGSHNIFDFVNLCREQGIETIYKSVYLGITESITVVVASERCNAPQKTRHQISSIRIISWVKPVSRKSQVLSSIHMTGVSPVGQTRK